MKLPFLQKEWDFSDYFVPFYSIYWIYKTAQRLDKMASARAIPSDTATLCLILAILVPFIPIILMQDKLNSILSSSGRNQPYVSATANSDSIYSAEEIKKYKELLDSNAITQEEYDEKKSSFLDSN